MLSIQLVPVEETVEIQDLFSMIGNDLFVSDPDDEQTCNDSFGLEVRSLDGYYPIEGFRITGKLPVWKLKTSSGRMLRCAERHLLFMPRVGGWAHIDDCGVGDYVMTPNGPEEILECERIPDVTEKMYDMQVSIAHSYYTNEILSHNSHFLVQLGAAAMAVGKNVLHYTMELNESVVGIRYDSHICRIPSNDVYDRRDDVIRHYADNPMGKLIIKEYPTKTPTVNTIRSHIEKAILKGIAPGLIVIDYADVMRSTKQYDSMRHELQHVYEEVRNLAGEMSVPVWTASQANRDSSNSDVVGLENMSEAYGKAMTADVVVSLSRKPMEKATGAARLFIAKNRAGRDGLVYPCRIDTSMSHIEILEDSDEQTLEQTKSDDVKSMKNALREQWLRLRKNDTGS